ncbi:MAG: M28 family peptidase [Bacteroidota bacterium]
MIRSFALGLSILGLSFSLIGQPSSSVSPQSFGDRISWERLAPHIAYLTSDSLAGREAGTPGDSLARAYLIRNMMEMGLQASVPDSNHTDSTFQQLVPLTRFQVKDGWLKVDDTKRTHLEDLVCLSGRTRGRTISLEPKYLARGTESDFGEDRYHRKAVLIRCTAGEIVDRYQRAHQAGASAVLLVTAENDARFQAQLRRFRLLLSNPQSQLSGTKGRVPLLLISPQTAAQILDIPLADWRKETFTLPKRLGRIDIHIDQEEVDIPTYNVIGWIPGQEHPEEVVVISVHYDHLGFRRGNLYPGADDNAAGVAAMLEIAAAFRRAVAAGHPPTRSLLFIGFAAEEKGLIGSKFYAKHPLFPFDQTIANLNMDMIGHLDKEHEDRPRFVSVVGSDWLSDDLHQIHEDANEQYPKLHLDYTYNSKSHPERFYYRSDQYNFARYGVPVIFYTSGDHWDYHKPTDTMDNLVPERVEGVAQLVFYTAWELAYREKAIRRKEKEKGK